jgi:hypothetical protein
MEHRVAEQTNAVERYLLDEFGPGERADFEAHLFDCPICGEQVRESAIAIANVKQVFREEGAIPEASRQESRNRKQSWAAWFRVPVLIPSLAALTLAVMLVYQDGVSIPTLQQPQVLSSEVIAPLAREAAPAVVINPRLPKFNLNFEVDAPRAYASYTCEFQRENGAVILKLNCGTRQVASFTLDLLLPTKDFPAGRYVMILRPAIEPQNQVQTYNFVIQDGGQAP